MGSVKESNLKAAVTLSSLEDTFSCISEREEEEGEREKAVGERERERHQ